MRQANHVLAEPELTYTMAAMTGTHHDRRWLTLPLALALGLALALAGCAGDPKPPSLPSLTPTTATPDASNTAALSDREQVKAVYTDFILHYPDAQDLKKSERREFLAKWLVDPLLTTYVDAANEQVRKHQRVEGTARPRIFSITLERTTATVDNCNDESQLYVKDTRTGKIVVRGKKKPLWFTAKLKRTDHGWRIYYTNVKDESCVGR